MSIGLSFTGRIDRPEALLEAAKILAAEQNYHLAAGETVFTDDTLVNVEGAKAVGLSAWHFTGAAGFESYLREELGLRF